MEEMYKKTWGDYSHIIDKEFLDKMEVVLKENSNDENYFMVRICGVTMCFETIDKLKFILQSFLTSYIIGYNKKAFEADIHIIVYGYKNETIAEYVCMETPYYCWNFKGGW